MKKNIVSILTFSTLFLGLTLAVIWLVKSNGDSKFEPALTALSLFVTLTGIFAERQAADYERKKELLIAFYNEIIENRKILLEDSRFNYNPKDLDSLVVFPRLIASVTEIAIASGVFEEEKSRKIFSDLKQWRNTVNEFNRRLYIIELRTFTNPNPVEMRLFYGQLVESGHLDQVLQLTQRIQDNLLRLKYLKNSSGALNFIQQVGGDN
jgi:hypothetical protein